MGVLLSYQFANSAFLLLQRVVGVGKFWVSCDYTAKPTQTWTKAGLDNTSNNNAKLCPGFNQLTPLVSYQLPILD